MLPQGRCHPGKPDPEIRVLTDGQSPFEQGECPWQVALPEEQQTDSPRGKHQAAGVIDRLGCSVSGTDFKGCDDPCVQGASSLWPESAVDHLLGEGVFEGVHALGPEPGLVQEFSSLKVGELTLQRCLGPLGDGLQ